LDGQSDDGLTFSNWADIPPGYPDLERRTQAGHDMGASHSDSVGIQHCGINRNAKNTYPHQPSATGWK